MKERETEELLPQLTAWRREFHKYAESGWLEMRTASRIARILKTMGYEPLVGRELCAKSSRMALPPEAILEKHVMWAAENGADPEYLPLVKGGFTGVAAEIRFGEAARQTNAQELIIQKYPVIAFRFDIDALGVEESRDPEHVPVKNAFRSVSDGVMHACGHDGHIAIGLGLAELLMRHRRNEEDWSGTVKLIFQPAEEGVRGGKSVAESGILKDVDYSMAGHIMPCGTSGAEVAVIRDGGSIGLATVKLDMHFMGKAAHAGAAPEEGCNAMLAAASAVLNLHAMPRFGSVPTQINVGKLTAGTGRNVVCDSALLEMEVRAGTSGACRYLEEYAERIAEHAASMHGCTCDVRCVGSAPVLKNSAGLTERALRVCRELGIRTVTAERSEGSSEDYAWFAREVLKNGGESLYLGFPCRCTAPNHDRAFDFDERVMAVGVRVFMGMAEDILSASEDQNQMLGDAL